MDVLIVDDHQLFASGLELLLLDLKESDELKICVVSSLSELVDYSNKQKSPSLILLDYYLPELSGEHLLARTKELFPESDLIIVSSDDSNQVIYNAMSLGAVGFIPKSSSKKVLIPALEIILNGGTYFPATIYDSVTSKSDQAIQNLTVRQRSVLQLVAQGLQNKQIAGELNISEGTVKAHLHAAFKELGVKNRTQAVLMASVLS